MTGSVSRCRQQSHRSIIEQVLAPFEGVKCSRVETHPPPLRHGPVGGRVEHGDEAEHLCVPGVPLRLGYDYPRPGNVAQSANVVLMQMRKDHRSDVIGSITEPFQLFRQRLVRLLRVLVVVKDQP